ncbi:uncharacterized protein LAJ45_07391 [Morchella importuna]|uniref:uncharacterized protein n=1 Tax=Morchella importuna TaxID=1174673 RepID=UPI001E8E2292|nr:uncharacterized protein LAJ45_07391 [Morchella importuna]KAH8148680.1 hypothetical protein LAJ45_07391 [Morchella importuna]
MWELCGRSEDPFLNKEQFFTGLYSLDSEPEQAETSEASLALAASRNQRYKRIVRRSSRLQVASSNSTTKISSTALESIRSTSIQAFTKNISTAAPEPVVSENNINMADSTPDISAVTTAPSTAPASLECTPRHLPPPESSRILPVHTKVAKRKRTPVVPAKKQIFGGMYFYFIPNDIKNPVRKFRVQKADEHGGFCLKEWREQDITHIIVDSKLKYSDVLKSLRREFIPDHIAIVNDTYISDCLAFARILNHDQFQYKVAGQPSTTENSFLLPQPHSPPLSSTPSETPLCDQQSSSATTQSLHIRPQLSKRANDTPSSAAGDRPTDSQLAVEAELKASVTTDDLVLQQLAAELLSTPGPSTTQECEVKDELDIMIAEAVRMGDLPLDDDISAPDDGGTSSDEEPIRAVKRKKPVARTGNSKWQDKFQCMHANDGKQQEGNPNARTIEILSEMQKYYEMTKDQWRSISYRKGISVLRKQTKKICTAAEARKLPMIGESLAKKIEEIVETDRLRKLEYAQLEPGDVALKLFLGVYGVGPSVAARWVQSGYKTLDDVVKNVRLTASQKVGIDHYQDFASRIPRDEVKRHGDIVMSTAANLDSQLQLQIMGSYRRGSKDCGDIDIMITKPGVSAQEISGLLDELIERLFEIGFAMCGLAMSRGRDDGSKWHGASKLLDVPTWRRIDLLVVPWDERGAALLYFTGNDIFNRSMRLLASKKGYGLNQRGLFKDILRGPQRQKLNDGTKVAGDSEEEIFEILGVPYRKPEERIC